MEKWCIFVGLCLALGFSFAQSNTDHQLMHNNVNRDYSVHTPSGYDTGQSLPLVICLHGMSGNVPDMIAYSNFNTIADTGNFIVVYPQGLLATTSWGATATQWDAYYGTNTKDLEFIDTLIDQMYYDYNIDLKKVYSTGHSNGGYMSYRLACELSERIAAIASVAGAMTYTQENNCTMSHSMPVLQIHGTADATVPFDGIAQFNSSIPDLVNFWRSKDNCALDSVLVQMPDIDTSDQSTASYVHYTNCDSTSTVLFYTVENGGHSWPGSFDVSGLGVTNKDFNASSVIWNFFNVYELNNPVIPEDQIVEDTTTDAVSYQMLEKTIKSIPNPFNDELQIQVLATSSSHLTISIHNALGQPVYQRLTFDEKLLIDTVEWEVGMYYVYVNGKMAQKVIKGE